MMQSNEIIDNNERNCICNLLRRELEDKITGTYKNNVYKLKILYTINVRQHVP